MRLVANMWMVAFVCACATGCIEADVVHCADGATCPGGTQCVVLTNPDQELCVDPDALVPCAGKPDYTRCGDQHRCYSGACLAIACGDGRIDRADRNDPMDTGEVCDDGNQTGGDGCSADCISDETCGNGVADPIKGELCDDGNFVQHDGCDSTCATEEPRWVLVSTDGPFDDRLFESMVYDAARDRIVMFGGSKSDGTTFGDTWEWNGAHWQSVSPLIAPSPRDGYALAYDGARERVVLFGGGGTIGLSTAVTFNDTWDWNGSNWQAHPVLVAPNPRAGAVMAYDSIRQRVVLFGGSGLGVNAQIVVFNDTWEWDGVSWTHRTDLGSPPTASPDNLMTYDPLAGRIILFVERVGETWSYDGAGWTRVGTTGPSSRKGAAMAYDAMAGGIVLFGGQLADGTPLGDAWLWSGSSWQPFVGGPAARSGAVMASQPTRGLVLFGGETAVSDPAMWLLRNGAWSSIKVYAVPADPLQFVMDPVSGVGVATTARGSQLATFTFDGAGWTRSAATASPDSGSTVYDEAHGVVVHQTGTETWLWDGIDWQVAAPSMEPDVLGTLGYDGVSRRVLQFGGSDFNGGVDETWAWDGVTWAELVPAHRPPPRDVASLAWDPIRRELVMFGGVDGPDALGDTWIWNGTDWSELAVATHPQARGGGGLAWNPARRRITLVGGGSALSPLNDVWELDREHSTWVQVALPDYPPAATGVSLVPSTDGSGLTLLGGQRGVGLGALYFSDLWQLRWDGVHGDETCTPPFDGDGDGLIGCADPDCWPRCHPLCPPGTTCDPTTPHCGDGASSSLESCALCPADTTCVSVCGDLRCDPSETVTACPGDCQ